MAEQPTPKHGLKRQEYGDIDWHDPLNESLDILDNALSPPGGNAEQILQKVTSANYDSSWVDVEDAVPDNSLIENDCINGTFDIWQRGDGVGLGSNNPGYYTADRFYNNINFGSDLFLELERIPAEVGAVIPPGNPEFIGNIGIVEVGSPDTNFSYASIDHRVLDGARKYSGGKVVFKVHVKGDAGKFVCMSVDRYTDGTTREYITNAPKQTLTGNWQEITFIADIPALSSGDTLAELNFMAFRLWFSAGTDYAGETDSMPLQIGDFYIAEMEIYKSDVIRQVRRPTKDETYDKCQLYYRRLSMTAGTNWADGTNQAHVYVGIFIQTPEISYTGDNGGATVAITHNYGGIGLRAATNRTSFGGVPIALDAEV